MKDTAREYGGGLFALAMEEGIGAQILTEFRMLNEMMPREYLRLLIDPAVPKSDRVGMVSELLDGRVHPCLANFVMLMTERRLAASLPDCFKEYERLYYDAAGIVRVLAESAVELSDSQKRKLEEKLRTHTGAEIEISYRVNPALIAGMRLVLENRTIDASVKTRLTELGASLAETEV